MVSSSANVNSDGAVTKNNASLNMGTSNNNSANRSNEHSGNALNLASSGPKTGVVGD